jgi:transposase-like protein
MPRRCTVCDHPERPTVDALLLEGGESNRAIARRFGLSKDAVARHREDHLPERLLRAADAGEVASADGLLSQLRHLHARTLAILGETEAARDHQTALRAIAEARRNLELLARLTELLGPETVVNVQIDARVQSVILEALRPYPEARLAVADALREVEGG